MGTEGDVDDRWHQNGRSRLNTERGALEAHPEVVAGRNHEGAPDRCR
jgi:hypothetical protein